MPAGTGTGINTAELERLWRRLQPLANDPNIPGPHPQRLRQRLPRIGPMPHQSLGPALPADRGFSPPYEISYRGVKPASVSAASRRIYLRCGAGLPQLRLYLPTESPPAATGIAPTLTPLTDPPPSIGYDYR
jgi:hypothetical protein